MRTYLISYDIPGPRRHILADAVMQLGEAWARPLEATWYVQSSERADALERRLRPLADAADGVLIQEVEANAVLMNTALRWFKRRRPAPPSHGTPAHGAPARGTEAVALAA
ncbi:MAG TPA: hypothetical protein VFZ16_23155 [Hyphomicrobiaceae bacterium]|nr:hypothetical protein [Hyphomicrobiaceae bacterium]